MEFVFVVPRTALFPDSYPHGFVPFSSPSLPSTFPSVSRERVEEVIARDGFFVERAYAERTPTLKQLIPYTLVRCETAEGARILSTRRLKQGGESRLHDKHSIGIGGHINPEDMPANAAPFGETPGASPGARTVPRNPLDAGTRRELAEELIVNVRYEVRRLGLINDDSNAVGAVHVGVVQAITVSGDVEIREREHLEGELVTYEDLQSRAERGVNFETWSKLLIPHLDELLPRALAVRS
jgi:predicted NUDIX family phosphoesterase